MISTARKFTGPTSKAPILGPGDRIGEGDCELVLDILPPDLADQAFETLRAEVKWLTMHHRGRMRPFVLERQIVIPMHSLGGDVPRLVAVQGEIKPDGRSV